MRVLLAPLLLSLLLAGCASERPAASPFTDVHGIALDPSDPDIIYVATHRGLFRGGEGDNWTRVGDAEDDFMGFSMHPRDANVMWASGHPSTGGNLGVLSSNDGGVTWERIALEGVDFHAMAVSAADPARIWGHWRGEVHRSDDGGHSWKLVSRQGVMSFAPHPTERDVVHAAVGQGIMRSEDAGATWTPLVDFPALGIAPALASPGTLYAGGQAGAAKSVDGGNNWERIGVPSGQTVVFFATHAATPDLVVAASYEKGIFRSDDGGATWRTLVEPSR